MIIKVKKRICDGDIDFWKGLIWRDEISTTMEFLKQQGYEVRGKITKKSYKKDKWPLIIIEFLNEEGCEVKGEIRGRTISIIANGPLKIEKGADVKSIIAKGNITSDYNIVAGNYVKTTGSIIVKGSIDVDIIDVQGNIESKKGSITADKIKAGGYIKSYAWISADEFIEAGLSVEVTIDDIDNYIKAPKISAGLNSKGNSEDQIIKARWVRCWNILNGTPINTGEYKDYYG